MLKRFLLVFFLLITVMVIGLFATGNEHIFRALQLTYFKGNTTANINDGQDFETHVISALDNLPENYQDWPLHENYNKTLLNDELKNFLMATHSAAYLIIKDGQLHTEFYFEPYNKRSLTNSFSMAKSILTMMVGAAIDEGIIHSFDDLVTNYIPEFKGKDVTLAQLSAMSSGVDWEEDYYSPFSPTPKLLYGYDVETYALSRDYPIKAGSQYYYASVSTQVLAIVLERALQNAGREMTLSDYLSKKFWEPMGMNDDATWHTDAKGMELAYCCINTNARNFAKFGQLLSQQGAWQGKQLLTSAFVERMIAPDLVPYYGHSIWTDDRKPPIFYAMLGHLGQFVIVVPAYHMVVVRLGEFRDDDADEITHFISKDVAYYVDEAIKRVNQDLPLPAELHEESAQTPAPEAL